MSFKPKKNRLSEYDIVTTINDPEKKYVASSPDGKLFKNNSSYLISSVDDMVTALNRGVEDNNSNIKISAKHVKRSDLCFTGQNFLHIIEEYTNKYQDAHEGA